MQKAAHEKEEDQRRHRIEVNLAGATYGIDGTLDEDLREFDAELLWNYEAGFKGTSFNDRLQAQLAVFYMDRDDVQISSSTLRLRPDGSTEFIEYIGNAAAGSNYGLEVTSSWQVNDAWSVYGSLGLLESEYKDFINSSGENLDGREQAHAPMWAGGDCSRKSHKDIAHRPATAAAETIRAHTSTLPHKQRHVLAVGVHRDF